MYWSLNLTQDATALSVQLNRSAGDPVLFLKPVKAGFQVKAALLNPTKMHRVPCGALIQHCFVVMSHLPCELHMGLQIVKLQDSIMRACRHLP